MTLSITASLSGGVPARVLLEVSSSPPVTNVLRVYRVHEDGTRNRVLTSGRALLNGTWLGYDYHAPFNQSVRYVASTGAEADSDMSGAVYVPSDLAWLQHPADPALSMPLHKIRGPQQPVRYQTRAEEFQILNSSGPPVVRTSYTSWSAADGQMTARVPCADVTRMKALLSGDSAVLLNGPWGQGDLGWMWIHPTTVSINNPGGFIDFPTRDFEISYRESRCPDVDVAPVWTLDDSTAAFPSATLADLSSVWASLGDMSVDRRL